MRSFRIFCHEYAIGLRTYEIAFFRLEFILHYLLKIHLGVLRSNLALDISRHCLHLVVKHRNLNLERLDLLFVLYFATVLSLSLRWRLIHKLSLLLLLIIFVPIFFGLGRLLLTFQLCSGLPGLVLHHELLHHSLVLL